MADKKCEYCGKKGVHLYKDSGYDRKGYLINSYRCKYCGKFTSKGTGKKDKYKI